jgi:hypothetical protein
MSLHEAGPHPDFTVYTDEDLRAALADIREQIKIAVHPAAPDPELEAWLTIEMRLAEAERIRRGNGHAKEEIGGTGPPVFQTMENIIIEDVDFIWGKRIPRGKLTLFDGDPGVGKSYMTLAIAARLSTGEALPFDKEPEAPLRSLILASEDEPGDTLKPRLEKLGADMSMIYIPNQALNLTADLINVDLIGKMIEQTGAAFVVIDPISDFTGGKNTNQQHEVREVTRPLADIAKKTKAAIVLVRHLNKTPGGSALYRGIGSIAFVGAARAAFLFMKDRENLGRAQMSHSKHNLSGAQPTIEYFIDAHTGAFTFGGESSETADDILEKNSMNAKKRPRDEAMGFLEETLKNGPLPANEVKELARKAGIKGDTLWNARQDLGIEPKKHGQGAWYWRLKGMGHKWPWFTFEEEE